MTRSDSTNDKPISHQTLPGVRERRVVSNIKYLVLLQIADFIFPLVSIPYIVRVLGPDYYGAISFASAVVMYFVLVTNYGFNLSATRLISLHSLDSEKVTSIYSSVTAAKAILALSGFTVLLVAIALIEKFNQISGLLLATYGLVIGHLMMPVWLFQGLEKMHFVTIFTVGAKASFTLLIFLFVRHESDYLLVPIFTSAGYVLAGGVAMIYIHEVLDIKLTASSTSDVLAQLRDGWHVFLSSISISLYTTTATLILGLVSNNSVVGFFTAADKLIQAAKGAVFPVSQALFPYVASMMDKDPLMGFSRLKRVASFFLPFMALVSLAIFLSADLLVTLIFGSEFSDAVPLLKIMSPLPLLIAASNLAGIQGLLTLGYKEVFSRVLLFGAFVGLLGNIIVVPIYEATGTVLVMLFVEFLITVLMVFFLFRRAKGKNKLTNV